MKIRTDFVTNSSSSSFSVLITITDINGKTYRFFDDAYRYNPDCGGEMRFNGDLQRLITQPQFQSVLELVQFLMDATNGEYTNATFNARKAHFAKGVANRISSIQDTSTVSVDRFLCEYGEGYDGYEFYGDVRQGNRNSKELGFAREQIGFYNWYNCLSLREHAQIDLKQMSFDSYNEVFDLDRYKDAITVKDRVSEAPVKIQKRINIITTGDGHGFHVDEDGALIKYSGPGGHVIVPDAVKRIGMSAFENCSNISRITLPENITSIGGKAFYGCEGLADQDGFVIVRGILFDYCGTGGHVVIPSSVKEIGESAFEYPGDYGSEMRKPNSIFPLKIKKQI